MQNTFSISCKWSKSILNAAGWESTDQLIEKLRFVPEKEFFENGFPVKADFIARLRKLIVSIEIDGDSVKEAKQMTAPGSVFESLSPEYLFLRNRYLRKRTKLK